MIPKRIAGVDIPDSKIARQVAELAREASPDFLFNHCVRTYLFGMLLAEQRGLCPDAELFFAAAVLHDMGLTPRGRGPNRFEVEGADLARGFLLENGLAEERADIVWDAVALHTSLGIADRKRPEIALVHQGAGLDVVGLGFDALPRDRVAEILAVYPRLGFKTRILESFRATIEAHPGSAVQTFAMDIARSCVDGFRCPTFPEMIAAAPFQE